ncbi:MAG TPA: Asp-tRNA(Asn)/Glu-tRNA(Gln) amidotransferase subunit GatC [Candidatus Methylomirabilis sp.]|nr:Asp-tRNA(Asn)/Glu-tRNA(Gln) amidotransferase subunit GatC [Candidatus Methylomirabilis sp.]
MPLTREDVSALAHLARIGLSDEELARAEKELEGVLGYVDRLQKVNTTGVEEAAPPAVAAASFREDAVIACDEVGRQTILSNFPARQDDLLKVPAIFEAPKR